MTRAGGHDLVGVAALVSVSGVLPVFGLASVQGQARSDIPSLGSMLGAVLGSFFAATAAGSVTVGRRAHNRSCPSALLRLACSGTVAATCLAGLACCSTVPAVAMILVVAGLNNANVGPSAAVLLSDGMAGWTLERRSGLVTGAMATAPFVPGAIAVLLEPHWRASLALTAAVPAGSALWALVSGRRHQSNGTTTDALGWSPASAATVNRLSWHLGTWVMILGLGTAAITGLSLFLTPVVNSLLASERLGQLAFGAAGVAAALVRVLVGVLAERRRLRPSLAVAVLMSAAGCGCFLAVMTTGALAVTGVVVTILCGFGWPGLAMARVLGLDSVSPAARGRLYQLGTFSGALVGPVVFHALLRSGDVSSAMTWLGVAFVAAAGLAAISCAY